jgi:hypothetical protein
MLDEQPKPTKKMFVLLATLFHHVKKKKEKATLALRFKFTEVVQNHTRKKPHAGMMGAKREARILLLYS